MIFKSNRNTRFPWYVQNVQENWCLSDTIRYLKSSKKEVGIIANPVNFKDLPVITKGDCM